MVAAKRSSIRHGKKPGSTKAFMASFFHAAKTTKQVLNQTDFQIDLSFGAKTVSSESSYSQNTQTFPLTCAGWSNETIKLQRAESPSPNTPFIALRSGDGVAAIKMKWNPFSSQFCFNVKCST